MIAYLRNSVSMLAAMPLLMAMTGGQVANLSGTWTLNVEKSKWGKVQKPVTASVEIDHQEPKLKYTGQIIYNGDNARRFAFDGAIDGKEYPMSPSYGAGKISIKRVDPYTIESVFRTDDGKVVETTRTTVSHDGKQMTRNIHVKGGAVDGSWTEVYDKK